MWAKSMPRFSSLSTISKMLNQIETKTWTWCTVIEMVKPWRSSYSITLRYCMYSTYSASAYTRYGAYVTGIFLILLFSVCVVILDYAILVKGRNSWNTWLSSCVHVWYGTNFISSIAWNRCCRRRNNRSQTWIWWYFNYIEILHVRSWAFLTFNLQTKSSL